MPPSDKVRIAFIGAGSHANMAHYPSLASFEDVEIAAICDINSQRLNTTADKYGVERRYADYRRMVEEVAPDAVYAIGQPHIFYDIWTWCLSQGLNLCIEKPMGVTLHQARMLAYLAAKKDCITQVSFQRRACPLAVKLRSECIQRGPIVHAVCTFYKCQPTPYTEARDHMMDDGVHAIDTLRWMCGGEVEDVQSITKRVDTPDINFFVSILQFSNDSTGVMMNSWTSGRRTFRVEMHAPGICAEAELEGIGALYADGDTRGTVYDTREVSGGDQLFIYGGFQAKNREFIDAVRHKRQPASHFSDALKTMEVADKILAMATMMGA
jgi:virulence factor